MIQTNFSEMQSAIIDNDQERLTISFQKCQEILQNSSDQSTRQFYTKICKNLVLEGLFKLSKIDESMRWFEMNFVEGNNLKPNLMTFEILIDGLLNHWKEGEAIKYQNLMEKEFKIEPKIGIFNSWISFYLKNFQLQKAKDLFDQIKRIKINPNEMTFRSFMKYFMEISDYKSAEEIKLEMAKFGIKPSVQFHNSMIKILSKKRAFKEIDSLLQEIKTNQSKIHLSTYKELIEAFASSKDYERITSLFNEMESYQIQPDVSLYNSLLAMYSDNESSDRARSLLLDMNSRGIKFNAFTYFSLLYGLIKQHKFIEAIEMISKMDKSGISLPSSTYARLIKLCCEKRFHPGIHFVRSQMKIQNVKPNLAMFSSLIEMNLRLLRYGSVEGLLREMQSEGLKWNVVIYGMFLNHFIENYDLKRVKILLERMKLENIQLTSEIYDTVMRAFYIYCRYAQGGYLFRVQPTETALAEVSGYDEVSDLTFTDNSMNSNTNTDSNSTSNNTDCNSNNTSNNNNNPIRLESNRLDISILKKNFESIFKIPFKLSVHIFNDLMLTFLRLTRFEEFFQCFAEIRRNNLKPNELTFTLLIKAQLYLGQPEAARSLFPEMLKMGLKPTVLQCALIFHVFCKNQATTLAEDFLSEMINQLQLKPNHVFYASLLYAYSRRRDYPNVFYTFDRLEKAGFTPDTETCNFVLSSLYEMGEHTEATRFFEKMVLQGIRRNTHTYYIMADRLVLQGDSDRFLEKLVDCLTPGNSIDAMSFNRLFNNYYRAGQIDVMRKVMEKMIEFVVKFDEGTLSFVNYLFIDYLNSSNLDEAEAIIKKAVIDYDPTNCNVKSMIDRFREHLASISEIVKLESFDKFLDSVDDLKRLWVLPSPLLPSEKAWLEVNSNLNRVVEPPTISIDELVMAQSN